MKLFGFEFEFLRKSAPPGSITIDEFIRRMEAVYETLSGIVVTPETCMEAPTVQAIVNAVTKRMASLPLEVLQKKRSNGRTSKEPLPDHPVAKLLSKPNDWQSGQEYWLDASSRITRYGRFFAFKARGVTGPIRKLIPLESGDVTIDQDDEWNVTFKVPGAKRGRDYSQSEVHYVRGAARDGLRGDSPVTDVRESIALEIAAERFGSSFFGNGAMPLMIFEYMQGFNGFKTDEEKNKFIEGFHQAHSGRRRFRALLVPKGLQAPKPVDIQNDKAQFLETRKYQRTVIAGAWGIPPHLVGDLERGTFNNVEQQSLDFSINAILPVARMFEGAMERDLLTQDDRNAGVIIRFNLDATLRGSFKERQEGLQLQRQNGVINANEWREHEGMNPLSDKNGGEEYWRQGPSGQSANASANPKPGGPNDPAPQE